MKSPFDLLFQNDFDSLKSVLSDKKRTNLNQTRNGNTLLHQAVINQHLSVVQMLIDLGCDVNMQDSESGYTSLHKSLYSGQLLVTLCLLKSGRCNLAIRDKEGLTCFDLLNSSIYLPALYEKPKVHSKNSLEYKNQFESIQGLSIESNQFKKINSMSQSAFSIYTWGSNSNFVLGNVGGVNRTTPKLAEFTPIIQKSNENQNISPVPTQIVIGKYQSAILSSDCRVYTYGHGSGGRLGTGNMDTCFIPTRIESLEWPVVKIALGNEHTAGISVFYINEQLINITELVITEKGSLYTWGRNQFGALGYTCLDESCAQPREVGGVIKKIKIIDIAVSKFHTCAISSAGVLFTWGKNNGQLGYDLPLEHLQLHPKRVQFTQEAISIACTNSSTAIISSKKEIFVISMNATRQVYIPQQNIACDIFSQNRKSLHHPVKIVSGNHQYAALMSSGKVYMWAPIEQFEYTKWTAKFTQQKPRLVWNVVHERMACKDIAIGIDSTLLLSTQSGHCYMGVKRKDPKIKLAAIQNVTYAVYFKFTRIPCVSNCIQVSAGMSGGFAILRQDSLPTLQNLICTPKLNDPLNKPMKQVSLEYNQRRMDVELVLEDGSIFAHREILLNRSLFFSILLGESSPWRVIQNANDYYTIKLPHVPQKMVKIMVEWIYTDTDFQLLDMICASSTTHFIETLYQLIGFCDEFLFEELVGICGRTLVPLIALQNVLYFIELGLQYRLVHLVDMCLTFCAWNLESLIESGAFTDLDTRIILTIQTRLLELQAIKNKFTRGPSGYYTLIKEQVQSIERIRKEQRKMNHHSQKFMLDVEDNLVLDPSHTLDCIEYETIIPRVIHTNVMNRIKSRKSSQRKEALNSSMSLESDDKMYSEIKAKVEVPGEPAIDSCILTPNALKPWHSAASFEKLSLLDIMEEDSPRISIHSESNQNTVISAPIKGYPSLQETMKIPTCKGSTLSLKCPISTHATVDQLSLNIKKIHSFPPQIKTTRLSQRDRRQAASTTTPTTPTSSSSSSLLSIVSSTSQDLILKDSKKWSLQPRQTPRMNSFIDIQNEQTIYTKQSNFQNSKISSITNTTPSPWNRSVVVVNKPLFTPDLLDIQHEELARLFDQPPAHPIQKALVPMKENRFKSMVSRGVGLKSVKNGLVIQIQGIN